MRTGKKELAAKTLFKRSGTTDVSAIKAAPSLYAQSVSPNIFIVDVKKEIVNCENGDILFQTEDELAKDAATFDTWQDFMEYYQGRDAPTDIFIPSDADAAWFQNFWQNTKNIHPTLDQKICGNNSLNAQCDALTLKKLITKTPRLLLQFSAFSGRIFSEA